MLIFNFFFFYFSVCNNNNNKNNNTYIGHLFYLTFGECPFISDYILISFLLNLSRCRDAVCNSIQFMCVSESV